ncbi:hypothetical protein U1Q18_040346 [Sarracenia purpurea var. burkii]
MKKPDLRLLFRIKRGFLRFLENFEFWLVASIEDEEDADGDGVVAGVLKESDESRPGDPVDEEDETDPKPKGGDVSVSEVVTGEGVNNKVISVSPVFLIRDGVGDAAFEDFVDSGVKVKQVREKSEDSCSARHVFENLPESPLEANLESGKPKALSPFFQGCVSKQVVTLWVDAYPPGNRFLALSNLMTEEDEVSRVPGVVAELVFGEQALKSVTQLPPYGSLCYEYGGYRSFRIRSK